MTVSVKGGETVNPSMVRDLIGTVDKDKTGDGHSDHEGRADKGNARNRCLGRLLLLAAMAEPMDRVVQRPSPVTNC